jgi:hypothetical protein
LIDKLEGILVSPEEFSSDSLETRILPILRQLRGNEYDTRAAELEKWCSQLDDACQAAFARETIQKLLSEVQAWGEWKWDFQGHQVDEKQRRVEDMKKELADLPIEWLKSRVTGMSFINTLCLIFRPSEK